MSTNKKAAFITIGIIYLLLLIGHLSLFSGHPSLHLIIIPVTCLSLFVVGMIWMGIGYGSGQLRIYLPPIIASVSCLLILPFSSGSGEQIMRSGSILTSTSIAATLVGLFFAIRTKSS